MSSIEFAVDDWIERLASALRKLAEAQEPYLKEYFRQYPRVHVLSEDGSIKPPALALDDLRMVYAMACHSHVLGGEQHYVPLCAMLDPARRILRSHPLLARVVSPIIGQDEFYLEILNTGRSTSSADLVAGLMARAAELSGDCFRKAVGDLHSLLEPAEERAVRGDNQTGWMSGTTCCCSTA